MLSRLVSCGAFLFLTSCGFTSSCFLPGTMIQTPEGERPIETLTPGDTILSQDMATGKLVEARVEFRETSHAERILSLELESRRNLHLTRHHRIYSASRAAWLAAKDLNLGEAVVALPGESVTTESRLVAKDVERHATAVVVYNLNVDGPGNGFANGVLVEFR